MNREDNPFYTLASHLKPTNNIQQINFGTVISISPLLINCNGLQLNKEDLLINKQLANYIFTVNSTFVLLTVDNQKFILLCEVI